MNYSGGHQWCANGHLIPIQPSGPFETNFHFTSPLVFVSLSFPFYYYYYYLVVFLTKMIPSKTKKNGTRFEQTEGGGKREKEKQSLNPWDQCKTKCKIEWKMEPTNVNFIVFVYINIYTIHFKSFTYIYIHLYSYIFSWLRANFSVHISAFHH